MYTVIICPDCEHPQIVKDDPKTTECHQCRSNLKFRKLKIFFKSAVLEDAQQARASIAAQQQGFGEEFEELDLDIDVDAVSDRIDSEYMAAQGLDSDDVSKAASNENSSNRSRTDIVRDAIRECDPATEDAIREYAEKNDVPGEKAVEILERMHERGDVLNSSGTYRLI